MHAYLHEYPPAPPDRVAEVTTRFPYRTVSAEEYAAREGFRWLCFSFDDYIYPDPQLNEWIHTLGDILFQGRLAEMQEKYLTAAERAAQALEKQQFLQE